MSQQVDFTTLRLIAQTLGHRLSRMAAEEVLRRALGMEAYHGFRKLTFSSEFKTNLFREVSHLRDVSQGSIQLELVCVNRDLKNEVHYHLETNAVVMGLGSQYHHLDHPQYAFAYMENKGWFDFRDGDIIEIPAKTKHGFTVGPKGILWFLSVQSPPIVGEGGHDDYYKE